MIQTQKTFYVYVANLEFYHDNKKRGINKGWVLIAVAEYGEEVSWEIIDKLIGLIA